MKRAIWVWAVLALAALPGLAFAETLLATSDWHLTGDRAAHAPAIRAVAEAARGCDVLLLLGDHVNNAHAEEHALVLESLAAIRESTGAEIYVVPGNHDLTPRLRPEDFASLYADWGWERAFSRDVASASCAVMTGGGTCLMLLDTNAYTEAGAVAPAGGVGEDTLRWLERVLDALPPEIPVIACGHHPILPPEARKTTNAGRLAEALREGGVKLYLCGHDHGFAAVNLDGLQQITVGQPQAYPGWAGRLEITEAGFHWRVEPLYAPEDPAWLSMEEGAARLGRSMAESALRGTPYEGDASAVQWFEKCFDLAMRSDWSPEACEALLQAPAARIWREIEPKSVVKRWIFGLLESCPQNVQEIAIAVGQGMD